MRNFAHAEKNNSSDLGMTVTRGATEDKSPAVAWRAEWPGLQGGAGEVLHDVIQGVSSPPYVALGSPAEIRDK